jgi:hypothetical protein
MMQVFYYSLFCRLLLGFSQSAKRITDSDYLLDATTMMTSAHFPRLHNAFSLTIRVPLHHLQSYLLQDLCQLLESLAGRKMRNLSDSTLVQLSSELGRHNFLISVRILFFYNSFYSTCTLILLKNLCNGKLSIKK